MSVSGGLGKVDLVVGTEVEEVASGNPCESIGCSTLPLLVCLVMS